MKASLLGLLGRWPVSAALAAVLLAIFEISFDLDTWIQLNVSIVYGLPLVLAAASGKRSLLWGLTLILITFTFVVYAQQIPPGQFALNEPFFLNRVLAALAVLLTAGLLHVLTVLVERLRARGDAAVAESGRKSRLLASVSHDMRTPLSTINLVVELIGRSAKDPTLAPQLQTLVEDLQRNTLSLSDLLSDALDISSIDAGHSPIHESEFSLNDLLAEERRRFEPLAQAKGLWLKLRKIDPDVCLNTDRVKLSRIVRNLVNNAVKFTAKGGVDIIGERAPDHSVLIRVADTGIGIRAEDLERIFDEFSHIEGAGQGERGWGLGLAICRRLAERMKAAIEVQSRPNVGSVFTIRFRPPVVATHRSRSGCGVPRPSEQDQPDCCAEPPSTIDD